MLVPARDEILVRLSWKLLASHQFLYFFRNLQVVSVNVLLKGILTEHSHNPNELVVVIGAFEKSVHFEYHSCHRAP